ncbi:MULTISPECIES: 2-hydroxyacyl-CoA dehydratase [unclassified Lactococcus]|uniref:2-hydroxyacyl-CoA dehydratase n=1 Tax=unclassified Lactococcus TaxID=2643510 RepID=UPI0011C90885|nr:MULTISPECIES: 2-hydroxyacyl-CoA dehydratase [unclassified Lactococcus]MQW23060.1 2-hydroxyglutaryl-CoA dehydratase [Lactococcus sp. dk101]TXK44405.1 2-hydroxyacyl-CoA dehydratase [Lactococcus sp. dk310]TXK50215.1 2-hydroxyacyl-CoA dehydratase [Lactococcus sp. dk322]
MKQIYKAGIDVGSTTVKLVVFDAHYQLIFSRYERHFSDVKQATIKVLNDFVAEMGDLNLSLAITGSGGMGLAEVIDVPFVQEVIASSITIEKFIPQTDVMIELGGEDAKMTFFDNGMQELRMNGTCAGGTGAFIDQMAALLKVDANGVNELAKHYEKIYPIASRCGVFAKTDVQPLLNEGVRREDIAASIFQAVVNQTIAGLASGRKIKGNVAFLGGPLFFMSELRKRFIETLDLAEENVIFPENPQLFVAMGAALADETTEKTANELIHSLENDDSDSLIPQDTMDKLFENQDELDEFRTRHAKATANYKPLSEHSGAVFLGIDAGSTTTKLVLIDEAGNILYDHYGSNNGEPLESVIEILKDVYSKLPAEVYIAKSTVTGYGEHLIKSGLHVDYGEVETMAHYKAADYFNPGVDFILDIGGQDMKAMRIRDGALSSIQLNEACSSGCGSFIETFANSLKHDVRDFAQKALLAEHPVNLGSRCTVFMNSKVKQVQKEGATVGDISAGLSYSVIKNALYKVIKVKRPEELGEKIVVQGGTFYNEAVLRAFEKISEREVVRPSIAGLMGAYGCALISLDKEEIGKQSNLLTLSELTAFNTHKEFMVCGLCENNCKMTLTVFNDGSKFVTGNRCERGAEKATQIKIDRKDKKVNLVDYKYKKLFKYRSLTKKKQTLGEIGIPRVLNMYENYPLWHTMLTDLGFRVVLSPKSDKELFEQGIETIPSDTVCYPAKMAHGHIMSLINSGIPTLFYPSVLFEQKEQKAAQNNYNCPIVQSYPEVIKNNIDEIRNGQVAYIHPFINLADPIGVAQNVLSALTKAGFDLSLEQVQAAVNHGFEEMEAFKQDLRKQAEDLLLKINLNQEKAIVLAGRPYHLDPEINHGIADIITQEGFHVLTEDSISHLEDVAGLRVVNQWVYHSRLYAAAQFVCKNKNLELVQLNSFGCGLDAVTTDQVEEIMRAHNKLYTVLKIDEGSNMGAVRIRLRSLKAAVAERTKHHIEPSELTEIVTAQTPQFTKEMAKTHTLLMPMLSPIHQEGLLDGAFEASGYHVVSLPETTGAVNNGLRFVNNDSCYPAIITIGQLIEALQSGQYDVNNTSVMMTQTGGGCRATNYIPLLRKALIDAGFPQVPVVSLSMGNQGTEKGFKFTVPLLTRFMIAVLYGDLFERVVYRTRPYESVAGAVDALHGQWLKKAQHNVKSASIFEFNKNMKEIIRDFDEISLTNDGSKPRVGVVGEILVKYSKTANNDIVSIIEEEGGEAVVLDLIGFMNYSLYNQIWRTDEIGFAKKNKLIAKTFIGIINMMEKPMNKQLQASKRFDGIESIYDIAANTEEVISVGNHTGEGWFLTGEMIELLQKDVMNIVCLQPFGCLPNHIVGKGMMKELRRQYPGANISPIDYDPGVSAVNQLNRIRLMMATAKKRMDKENPKIEIMSMGAH